MRAVELAKQLGKALAESDEFRKYQQAKTALEGHEAARLMLEDFRQKQLEYQQKKLNGAKFLEPYETELQKLSTAIGLNPFLRDYIMAEMAFSGLMMEVQKQIGAPVGLHFPEPGGE